jgi:hypothetical protein
MKTISIFLALVNSLLAGLLITFLFSSPDIQQSAIWWTMARIMIALSVILIGVLTWISAIGNMRPSLVAMASLFLVALGPATMVWTFHRAQLTGDMEYYMILYGGSLAVQGITLLFGALQEQRGASIA